MRTLLAGEFDLALSGDGDVDIKLEVQNGSGTWKDAGVMFGKHWIINASWGEHVDTIVSQAIFVLIPRIGTAAVSPLIATSTLNVDDFGAYSPLFDVGRLVRAFAATTAHGVAPTSGDYRPIFTGRIDNVDMTDPPGDMLGPVTITCSDLGSWLMDLQIETEGTQYGALPDGVPLADVMQAVLNASIPAGDPPVTVVKESSSDFAVRDYKQGAVKVMEALQTLVLDSTGEDVRYRFDAAHVSQLTWMDPDRSRITVDGVLGTSDYLMSAHGIALAPIRNAFEMAFSDPVSGESGVVTSEDLPSESRVRRRFNRLGVSPLISTRAEAQAVVDIVSNDLAGEPLDATALCSFLWFVQLYDRYTFTANGRQYTDDQTLCVVGYQHAVENSKASTTLTCTGRVMGAYAAWLRRIAPSSDVERSLNILRINSWESADGLTRWFTVLVGTRVETLYVHHRTVVITETADWHDFSDTAVLAEDVDSPLIRNALFNYVTFSIEQPQRGNALAMRLVPFASGGRKGDSVTVTIDAAPPAINATIHATKTGALARMEIDVAFGASDGPISLAVIERVLGTPTTLLTLAMSEPATIDWTGYTELDARPIPKEADSISWTAQITDISGNVWTFGPTYALPSTVLITPTFVESDGSATVTVVVIDAGAYLDKLHVDGAITGAISWHVTRDGLTSVVACTSIPGGGATSGTYTRTETLAPLHPVQVAGFVHYIDGDTECFGVWPFDSLKTADVVNVSVGNTPATATVKVTWDTDAKVGTNCCRFAIDGGAYSETVDISGAYLSSFDIARTSSKQTITIQAKNAVDAGATWGNVATVDVDEFETGSVYSQCTPTITSYDDTTVTVTVTATSTLGTPTVGLVGFIGCTLASGHAAGTYTYAQNGTDNVWVFNRAAAGSGEVGQAIFRAYYAGSQTDDGQAPIPIIGSNTIFLAIRARHLSSDATTVTFRVASADPTPQGDGSVALTFIEAGGTGTACSPASGAGGPHSDGTIDPGATIDEAADSYIDFVVTRPAFGTGTRQVIFTATATNRVSASDPVYVAPVQRESFGPSLVVTPTSGATAYAIAWSGTGTITLSTDNGETWSDPNDDAHATAGASPLTAIARPAAGSVPIHYTFKAVADSQTVTDDVEILPIDQDTVTPDLTVVPSSPLELTQVFTATATNPQGGAAPTITFTLYGCTADGGTLIADLEHMYSAPITVDRPIWDIATQASVTFKAAIAGGGAETISRTILNQLRDTNNISRITSAESSDGATRNFTLLVGTRTTQVHVHYRTVRIIETEDWHDFSDDAVLAVDAGSPLVKMPVANVVTFSLPQPRRKLALAARLIPYDVVGNEGVSIPLTIDAAPPAINAVIHATKAGAYANLSIDIAFGPSDGPVSVSVIERLIGTAVAPNTLTTFTMDTPDTVDLSTVPALGSRPIPADADSVSWTVEITDADGEVWTFGPTVALPSAVLIHPTAIENTATHTATVTVDVVDAGGYLDATHNDGGVVAAISWHVTTLGVEAIKASDTEPMSGTTGGYILTEPLNDLHSVKIDGYAHYVDGSTELFGSWTFDSNKIAGIVNASVAYVDTAATVTVVWDSDALMGPNCARYDIGTGWVSTVTISDPARLSQFTVTRTSAKQTVVVQAKNAVDAGVTWGNQSTIEIDAYLGYALSATPTEAAGVGTVTLVVGDPAALFDAAFMDGAITSQISWHVTRAGIYTAPEASTSVPGGGATTGTWTKDVTLDPLHNVIVVAVGHFLAAPTSRIMGSWTFDSDKIADVVIMDVVYDTEVATVNVEWDTDALVGVNCARYRIFNVTFGAWVETVTITSGRLSQFDIPLLYSRFPQRAVQVQAKNAVDAGATWGNVRSVGLSHAVLHAGIRVVENYDALQGAIDATTLNAQGANVGTVTLSANDKQTLYADLELPVGVALIGAGPAERGSQLIGNTGAELIKVKGPWRYDGYDDAQKGAQISDLSLSGVGILLGEDETTLDFGFGSTIRNVAIDNAAGWGVEYRSMCFMTLLQDVWIRRPGIGCVKIDVSATGSGGFSSPGTGTGARMVIANCAFTGTDEMVGIGLRIQGPGYDEQSIFISNTDIEHLATGLQTLDTGDVFINISGMDMGFIQDYYFDLANGTVMLEGLWCFPEGIHTHKAFARLTGSASILHVSRSRLQWVTGEGPDGSSAPAYGKLVSLQGGQLVLDPTSIRSSAQFFGHNSTPMQTADSTSGSIRNGGSTDLSVAGHVFAGTVALDLDLSDGALHTFGIVQAFDASARVYEFDVVVTTANNGPVLRVFVDSYFADLSFVAGCTGGGRFRVRFTLGGTCKITGVFAGVVGGVYTTKYYAASFSAPVAGSGRSYLGFQSVTGGGTVAAMAIANLYEYVH